MRRWQTTAAVGFIVAGLLAFIVAAAFEGGLSATAYGTTDSKGFAYGFNNRLTPELYGIIFANASLESSLKAIGIYGIVCFVMHLTGIWIVILTRRRVPSWARDAFFLSQVVLFPFAWLGMAGAGAVVYDIVRGTADGETFTDGVPVSWMAHGVWVAIAVALYIFSTVIRRGARPWREPATRGPLLRPDLFANEGMR